MTEIIKEIQRLKQEKSAVILVHNYQIPEVQEIADYLGDSLGLAKKAAETDAETIVFCGVKFMAETAKILSPKKQVLLPEIDAGCPMAMMADAADLLALKSNHPNAKIVSYVNSTAAVKAVTDVCCTSSNAVKVVKNIDANEIIFAPDKNLASWVARFVDKTIIPWNGYCQVHERIQPTDIDEAREIHPDATIIVHPECKEAVVDRADQVGSTSQMMDIVKKSDQKEFVIGTEMGLIQRLEKENPNKQFYSAGNAKICQNMKKINLKSVYQSLHNDNYEINLDSKIMTQAEKSLKAMLKHL